MSVIILSKYFILRFVNKSQKTSSVIVLICFPDKKSPHLEIKCFHRRKIFLFLLVPSLRLSSLFSFFFYLQLFCQLSIPDIKFTFDILSMSSLTKQLTKMRKSNYWKNEGLVPKFLSYSSIQSVSITKQQNPTQGLCGGALG